PPREGFSIGRVFHEMWETLANRSLFAIFITALFANIAAGLGGALSNYFSIYFWGFTSAQIGVITLAIFVSALLGAWLAAILTRRMGKKRAAIWVSIIGTALTPVAILLKLFGVIHTGADPLTFWVVFIQGQLDVMLVVSLQALLGSMISDLVEQSEVKTGRRSEGVFFAA